MLIISVVLLVASMPIRIITSASIQRTSCDLGQVKIAKSMRTGQYAAVKIVPRHIMVASAHRYDHPDPTTRRKMRDREERREERQRLTLEREIVIMKLIDHPNVISLLDVHEKDGMM